MKSRLVEKTSSTFSLNPLQKRAVETIEGPVMVIAGPGTGKTQILASRIAQILKTTDAGVHNILALTFTEAGAKAMRERLISMVGKDAFTMAISTFHSFAGDVIASYPEYFPFSRAAEPLSDLERFEIIESIIMQNNFETIKPVNRPLMYVRPLIKTIQDLKREGIDPNQYRKVIEQEEDAIESNDELSASQKKQALSNCARNKEALQVYVLYQEQLQQRGRYDYEDMIAFVSQAFEQHPDLLQIYQERFQYVLVDEFQDTNAGQNKLLQQLMSYWGDQANIFVVGDVSQSIYRFQGASAENMLSFIKAYPKAEVITLTQNYRSTQTILDAATSLIQNNTFTHETVLQHVSKSTTSEKKKQTALQSIKVDEELPIEVAQFSSSPLEAAYVATQIQKLLEKKIDPTEIAVIYRNNADSGAFEDALNKWNIPYEIRGGINVLEAPVMRQFLTLCEVLQSIQEKNEAIDIFTVMNYEWVHDQFQIDPLDVLFLARYVSQKQKRNQSYSFFDALQEKKSELHLNNPEAVHSFTNQLEHWTNQTAKLTFPEWFELVMNESGFLNWIMKRDDAVESMNRLQSLFREVKGLARLHQSFSLKDFQETLHRMEEHKLEIQEDDLNVERKAVTLTTAHSAKGLEWSYVFLVRAVDGVWSNTKSRELISLPQGLLYEVDVTKKEQNEDDRRLFYVALTRAKKKVSISFAATTMSANRTKQELQTQFLSEIPQSTVDKIDTSTFESTAKETLFRLLSKPAEQSKATVQESEWIDSLLENYVLAPTALSTYLECAYKYKLSTLIKVPRAKQPPMSFGSAVHAALQFWGTWMMEQNAVPTKEQIIEPFEKALLKETLTHEQYEMQLKKGREVLSKYYDEYKDAFQKPLMVEAFLGYGRWSQAMVDDIKIGGRIDKIELIDAKTKMVHVVDFKTGRPRSRNEIEGKPPTSDGRYKLQLVFYALLAKLDKTFPFTVGKATLDFVEPMKPSGKFKQESFVITNEEIEDLKKTIRENMQKIRSHQFERTTNYEICKNCEFQKHCWPEGIPKAEITQLALEI